MSRYQAPGSTPAPRCEKCQVPLICAVETKLCLNCEAPGSTSGPTEGLCAEKIGRYGGYEFRCAFPANHSGFHQILYTKKLLGGDEVEGGATTQPIEYNDARGIPSCQPSGDMTPKQGAAPLMEQSTERYKPVLSLTKTEQSPLTVGGLYEIYESYLLGCEDDPEPKTFEQFVAMREQSRGEK